MAKIAVAPLVGAWIEIHTMLLTYHAMVVAPLVGAWIEIREIRRKKACIYVAPLVGAWIEICIALESLIALSGRSPRGSVD